MAQIKKDTSLRKSILQAAITGQLISSCHSELDSESPCETGKELLDKIIEERNNKLLAEWEEALKKNPKAKKPAPIVASEIDEEEIPFEIPENWCWCRLGDLFITSSGTTPASKNPDYYLNGTINWVRTTDLNNDILTSTEIKITEKAKEDCNLKIIPQDSVCIALYGGAGTIGKNAIIKFDTTINQSVCAIHPNNFCSMKYIQWFIQWQRPNWMELASGSRKDPNINQIVVKNRQIPIQNKNRLAKKYNCRILRSVDCKDLQGQDETFSLLLAKELKKEEILLIKDSTFAFGSPEILKDYYLLSSGWEQKTANEFISKFLIDLEKAEEQFEDTKNLTPLNKRLKLLASNYKEILESVKYQTTDDDLKPLYSKMMEISKCKENYQAFITHILRTPTIYEEKKEK